MSRASRRFVFQAGSCFKIESGRASEEPGRHNNAGAVNNVSQEAAHSHEFGQDRMAGILLHPTSLPGPYGIGDLGEAATASSIS